MDLFYCLEYGCGIQLFGAGAFSFVVVMINVLIIFFWFDFSV